MKKEESQHLNSLIENIDYAGAGFDVLRYICLPDLLGNDANTILYLMGKNLARKKTFTSIDDMFYFFKQMGWGALALQKEKRKEIIFGLSGNVINQRLHAGMEHEYRLEAGFLAQAMQQLKDVPCECIDELNKNKAIVEFRVLYSS